MPGRGRLWELPPPYLPAPQHIPLRRLVRIDESEKGSNSKVDDKKVKGICKDADVHQFCRLAGAKSQNTSRRHAAHNTRGDPAAKIASRNPQQAR